MRAIPQRGSSGPARPLLPATLLLTALACGAPPPGGPAPAARADDGWLVDVTERLGPAAKRSAWPEGTFFVPEIMGAGLALLDHDADGDLDLLQLRFPPPGHVGEAAPNRLFRQREDGTFEDDTERSGLGDPGYGQGVAVGDVDDDGDLDVYLANYGADALYLNRGDGTFARAAGAFGDRWSSAATFCDVDRDGDLDLYVVHYLRYRFQERCSPGGTGEDYCSPETFDGEPDALYLNDGGGGGGFRDATRESGIGAISPAGKGLGVVCLDLTADGWPDLYVANDGQPNHLWVNRGDGSFAEEAMLRGLAVNRQGSPEASMGIAVGDVDGDGIADLFLSHLARETNTLYRGEARAQFQDRSIEAGLSERDLAWTGFGCALFDPDQDGDLDLAVVNGRIQRGPVVPGAGLGEFWNAYAERNVLFVNDGSGRFTDASGRAGAFSAPVEVSRGLAVGDLDGDGDPDLALSNADGSLRLLRNDAADPHNHWVLLRLLVGPRDALGARATLLAPGRRFVRWALAGSSYQSSNDPRVHVGLGTIDRLDGVEVLWPDGRNERFPLPEVDREYVLREGEGGSP